MCLRMGLFVFCLTYRIRSLMKLSVLHTLMYYLHVHEIDCYVYTLIAIDTLIYTLVRKEGEGERRAMLRMRIGRDFTTLGTIVSAYLSTISLLHVLHIASTGGCYLLRCSVLLYLCAFLPIDRLISGRCTSIARIYP